MTTELLMSATLGLAMLSVSVYFIWRAGVYRRRIARLQAQYDLYAVRDRLVRLVAEGKLKPDSDLFLGLVDLINTVIGLDRDADYYFFRWLVRTGYSQDGQAHAEAMVSAAVGPGFEESDVMDLAGAVGEAVEKAICANSRMLRLELKLMRYGPDPDRLPRSSGSVSIAASNLPALRSSPAFAT